MLWAIAVCLTPISYALTMLRSTTSPSNSMQTLLIVLLPWISPYPWILWECVPDLNRASLLFLLTALPCCRQKRNPSIHPIPPSTRTNHHQAGIIHNNNSHQCSRHHSSIGSSCCCVCGVAVLFIAVYAADRDFGLLAPPRRSKTIMIPITYYILRRNDNNNDKTMTPSTTILTVVVSNNSQIMVAC